MTPRVDRRYTRSLNVIRNYLDLLITIAVTLLTAAIVIAFPGWQSPLRVALGLVVVLLAPGYVLMQTLFARRDDVDGVERLALTLGLSIAAVPILGLLLDWSPWGIRPAPMAIALSGWVVAFAGLAAWRRRRAPPGTAFEMPWGTPTMRQGAALFALVMAVLLGVPALAVALRPPNTYTEFYVLGSTGQLQSYPTRLEPGERFPLTFGVGNFEDEAQRYLITAPFDEDWQAVTPLIAPGERWEQPVELTAPDATGRTQLRFELYRFDAAEPYRSLHLFVTLPGPTVFPGMEQLELRPLVPIEAPDDVAPTAAGDPSSVRPPPEAPAAPATPASPPPPPAAAPAPSPTVRVHRLAPGETLYGLARTYLGDGARYREILELNRDLIDDPTDIPIGTPLRIPVAP